MLNVPLPKRPAGLKGRIHNIPPHLIQRHNETRGFSVSQLLSATLRSAFSIAQRTFVFAVLFYSSVYGFQITSYYQSSMDKSRSIASLAAVAALPSISKHEMIPSEVRQAPLVWTPPPQEQVQDENPEVISPYADSNLDQNPIVVLESPPQSQESVNALLYGQAYAQQVAPIHTADEAEDFAPNPQEMTQDWDQN
jgi:hypothetical protein